MAEASAIEAIRERLRDLIEALREAGAVGLAKELVRLDRDFTSQSRVRRSVEALRGRCEGWRSASGGLPDTAKIQLAANRLEDACREALAGGVIIAAEPTLAEKSRRKLRIVLVTLAVAGLLAMVPVVLTQLGIDVTEVEVERKLAPVSLPQGQETSVELTVLAQALVPEAAKAVEIDVLDGCERLLIPGQMCGETKPRLWATGRSTTYEVKLPNQAYGLLFTLLPPRLVGGVGHGKMLLAATDNTPQGQYEIPLSARYLGYTPRPCQMLERLQDACPSPVVGEGEAHAGLEVPVVVVDVVKGDPNERSGEERLARAQAEEARRKAEERAVAIAAATEKIEQALDVVDTALRKRRWQDAKERIDKLDELFEPLEALAEVETNADVMPVSAEEAKLRYEGLRERLGAQEDKIFERAYAVLNAPKNKKRPDSELMDEVARRFQITVEYLDEIYVTHADELQKRMEQEREAHEAELQAAHEALEARCGARPGNAFHLVEAFLKRKEPEAQIMMGQCLTPRLEEGYCWVMRCDWQTRVEVAVELPKVVTKYRGKFYLKNDAVTGHVQGRVAH